MNEGPDQIGRAPQDFKRFVPSLLPASCLLPPPYYNLAVHRAHGDATIGTAEYR